MAIDVVLTSSPSEANTSSIFDSEKGSGEFSSTVMWRMALGEGELQGERNQAKHSQVHVRTQKLAPQKASPHGVA